MGEELVVDGVSAGYGRVTVLHEVSLTVGRGETVALLGANGAGKTTLARTVMGLLRPSAGAVRLGERVLSRMPTHEITRAGAVLVPEGRRLFRHLSVEENLELALYRRGKSAAEVRERVDGVLTRFPRLLERRTQRAGTMSGGEQQMLAIARALLLEPSVLVLDEPSTGLAPLIVQQIFDIVRELASGTGCGVLLIEQNARAALELSDRGYVLERGRLIMSGEAAALLADEALVSAYLG